MQSKLIQDKAGERICAVVFDPGEEILAGLREFARAANLTGARLTAIGAFSDAVRGFFDPDAKQYVRVPVRE